MNAMFFTMMATYAVILFWVSMVYFGLAAVVIYIVARWRDSKGSRHDSQIGAKVALHFLMSLSIFIAVSGGSVIVVDQMLRVITDGGLGFPSPSGMEDISDPYSRNLGRGSRRSDSGIVFSAATRTGLGLLVAGTIMGLIELWLIHSRTNDRRWPAVRRSFVGSRAVVHGIVVTAAMTGAFVVGFQEAGDGEVKKNLLTTCLGLLGVWGFSLVIHLSLLFWYTRQSDVPGENFCCHECGEDLRGKLNTGEPHCPNCRSVLGIGVRRTLSSMGGSYATVQIPSDSATAGTDTPASEGESEKSE